MSFSPVVRVRKLLDKMKSESPRIRRFSVSRRSSSADLERPLILTSEHDFCMEPFHKWSKFETVKFVYDPTKPSPFKALPIEAFLLIFSFLESTDLLQAALVSYEWNCIADDELLWKNLVVHDWNVDAVVCNTWKESYHRLETLCSEGVWEGMSKWIEPSGYDNEQKTTARLWFQKRRGMPLSSPETKNYSPKPLRRVNSTTLLDTPASSSAMEISTPRATDEESKSNPKGYFGILGGGVTVNCASPSPFRIEGERVQSDSTGSIFKWNKQFEKHTSFYEGKIDFATGMVTGTISYHDGTTHWKGIFHYEKSNKIHRQGVNA